MDVEYTSTKNYATNPLIYDIINASESMNHSGNYSTPSLERWTRPWYLYALFFALIILSLSLNAVVIIACIRANLWKHPTNLYFLNLAIGDVGIALGMIIYLHNMDIPWTVATCKLFLFMQLFITIFSLNTLLLVAVERFVAVRLPMKFQTFTTQRSIIRQLFLLWLISTALVLYPSLNTPVTVKNGCFRGLNRYHLSVILPSVLLMFVIYISILLKLRQISRQRQSRSHKITSTERLKEMNVNSEYSCELSKKRLSETNVSYDVVSTFNDASTIDNIDTEQEICNIDRDNCHKPDVQDITKPDRQCNPSTANRLCPQCVISTTSRLAKDLIYNPNILIHKISTDGKPDIPSPTLGIVQTMPSSIDHSTGQSVKTSIIGSQIFRNIHNSPKPKRTTIDQRNKKAILLVLVIFLIMLVCHTGLIYNIIYASIYNLGQEYVYSVGDVIILPYFIHTCITPVLQLRFNDVVRMGLPIRRHQARAASP